MAKAKEGRIYLSSPFGGKIMTAGAGGSWPCCIPSQRVKRKKPGAQVTFSCFMMSATLAQEMVPPPGCRLSLPTSINPIRDSLTDMTRGFYVIFRSCQVDNCLSQGRTVHVKGAESESASQGWHVALEMTFGLLFSIR